MSHLRRIWSYRYVVADDSPSNRKILMKTLKAFGARFVREACTGAEALAEVDRFEPDILLLDWFMPDMTGGAVLCDLAQRRRWDNRRQVIVMTGYPTPEIVREALALGAATVIRKPFAPRLLLERLGAMPVPDRLHASNRVPVGTE